MKMFEFLFRKTIVKNRPKEEQDFTMLLKDKFKVEYLSYFLLSLLAWMPAVIFVIMFVTITPSLFNILSLAILVFVYLILVISFRVRFKNEIEVFRALLFLSMYTTEYVLKGKALSQEDFETIKKENPELYQSLMLHQSHGYCYSICFSILKCLKKGMMLFVAVKNINKEDENDTHEYTMHVLYVNNQWCFDTYSQRQHPINKVLEKMGAIPYTSFGYENIGEKTYEEFRAEHAPALEDWCNAHDCHQTWKE